MMIGRRGFLKGLLGLTLVGVSGRLIGGGTGAVVAEVVPATLPGAKEWGHRMMLPTQQTTWHILSKQIDSPHAFVGTLTQTLSALKEPWLLCDGRLVSIEEYRDLFNVIGATYGCSPARFRLPDLRGRQVTLTRYNGL